MAFLFTFKSAMKYYHNNIIKFREVNFMEWIYLLIAGLFEVSWAIGLKYSQGFTKIVPGALTVVGMVASFYFLSLALKTLPLGNAYAIWTGIGTVGTVILGVILFKEPINVMRMMCILFIVFGIIGLKLISID
jgi:quaternary ammonium compound-resistance protein SugE